MTPLLHVLGLGRADVAAVAGAGGKTTLVYRLAREAREAGARVLVTTTTHMGMLPEEVTGPVVFDTEPDAESRVAAALRESARVTLLGRRLRPDKLEGVPPERVDALAELADLVLVEADGARGRSLKVPAAHEPVIPRSTTLVVVVAGLDVVGQPLDDGLVHRVELVAAASGRQPGQTVDEDVVVAALTSAEGYPSRIAPGVRAAVFLNKAEDARDWAAAERIGPRLLGPYAIVAAGSARSGEVRSWS